MKEWIYNNGPIWLQNLLVSGYGAKLYYERYFGFKPYREFLERSQWLSSDEIERASAKMLGELLTHAYRTVPYYRSLFDRIGIRPQHEAPLSLLADIPLLQKEVIRRDQRQLLSSKFAKGELITLNTSGTTGKSLQLFVDIESRRKAYAFTNRYHAWAGLKNGRNNVTFGGRAIVPPQQKKPVFWRYNAAMGNYLFSSYHMSDANLPYYLEKIRKIQPAFIEAYPSAAYLLAKYVIDHGPAGLRPKAILTSGETLFDHQRELIQEAFGCSVFDQYGCTEQALFVSQCEQGAYHVHPEFGLVELLDDQDFPVPPGVTGRVVCTSFVNMAMPLIRYEIGDTAQWGSRGCSCGRYFPVLKKICGRQDDYIVTPEGNRIGRLDPIFKGIRSVKEAQIVQERTDFIRVVIVPGEEFGTKDSASIINELQKRTGSSVSISLEVVDAIERTANGKIRSVISKL